MVYYGLSRGHSLHRGREGTTEEWEAAGHPVPTVQKQRANELICFLLFYTAQDPTFRASIRPSINLIKITSHRHALSLRFQTLPGRQSPTATAEKYYAGLQSVPKSSYPLRAPRHDLLWK